MDLLHELGQLGHQNNFSIFSQFSKINIFIRKSHFESKFSSFFLSKPKLKKFQRKPSIENFSQLRLQLKNRNPLGQLSS